jgi:hypothetical protein
VLGVQPHNHMAISERKYDLHARSCEFLKPFRDRQKASPSGIKLHMAAKQQQADGLPGASRAIKNILKSTNN